MGHSATVSTITDAAYISKLVGERLIAKGLLQSPLSLQRCGEARMDDPDGKIVFVREGVHDFVVAVSPPLFPEVVAEDCLKAAQMRSQLGGLAAPILEPLDTGRIEESSYAVLPYRKPLSTHGGFSWLDRMWLRRHLLEWLLQVAARRGGSCGVSRYEASLRSLRETVPANTATAALLVASAKHFDSGRFTPRTAPMHGDLWKGNVLHGAGSTAFALVDWRGSATHGFPIFDLIRAAASFDLSPKVLERELQLHRVALGCQVEDLPIYLLGALGHYAARLGEMPPARFQAMADECVERLSSALGYALVTDPNGASQITTVDAARV
jgi:phosphotransferase family enzyme